jgi:hypothetical protein
LVLSSLAFRDFPEDLRRFFNVFVLPIFVTSQQKDDVELLYVYTNEFKSWSFGKEAAQIFVSGASDHC